MTEPRACGAMAKRWGLGERKEKEILHRSQASYAPGNFTNGPGFPIQPPIISTCLTNASSQYHYKGIEELRTAAGTLDVQVCAADVELRFVEAATVAVELLRAQEIISWGCGSGDGEIQL